MKKVKIAISLDHDLLEKLDAKVDGNIIRSRSQAIEVTLIRGLKEKEVDTAVILISAKHHPLFLAEVKGKMLLQHHLEFFLKNNIKNIIITTQKSNLSEKIKTIVALYLDRLNIEVVENQAHGNAEALVSVKDKLKSEFIAISGDLFIDFQLKRMIEFHRKEDMLGTLGLMTRPKTGDFGVVILEGDKIIDFKEKEKNPSPSSLVVNAGIYILKPEVFELFDEKMLSLEKDLFPKIARIKQLIGYFTYGEYYHMEEFKKAK